MKLLFKQRFFSWLDSYDIYDEFGNVLYVVKGQLSWGHRLAIFDPYGNQVGMVQQKVLTLLPKFELYDGNRFLGYLRKEFTFFRPHYSIDQLGWQASGSVWEWDYDIKAGSVPVAHISKQLLRLTDTYVLDVYNPQDALPVLMFVLAIDAEKCSRDND